MSIDSKLDVKQINQSNNQNHRGFFNKAKYAILVPLIAFAIACTGGYDKELLNKKNIIIRSNSDCSKIKMVKKSSDGKRIYVMNGPSVEDFLDAAAVKLTLEEYIFDPKGKGPQHTKKYDERDHPIEGRVLKEKQLEAESLFFSNYDSMLIYLKR